MYNRLFFLFAIVVAIAFFVNGCQDSSIEPPGSQFHHDDAGNGCTTPNEFCGSPGIVQVQNACDGDVQTIDLWAGVGNATAGTLVGRVELWPNGDNWKVKYIFTDPLFIADKIHFAIGCSLSDIPQTGNGNPKPGQFPYKFNGPFGSSFEFNITLPTGCTCYYVAAHAGGNLLGFSNFNASLPVGCVTASNIDEGWHYTSPFVGCYANFTLSNAGAFNGTWCGWCIDLGTSLGKNQTFNCACIYSSYDTELNPWLKANIEGWQNFDKVNYLINHFQVGQLVQPLDGNCNPVGAPEQLTVMDIQKAIWILLDLGPGSFRPEWEALSTPEKRNAILCDVDANGEGFVPNCANGDEIVFIVDPDCENHTVQPMIASIPCTGGGSATAWGDGKYGGQFLGPNWATYFKWCPTCPE